mgnify:CR=1 FL=1
MIADPPALLISKMNTPTALNLILTLIRVPAGKSSYSYLRGLIR